MSAYVRDQQSVTVEGVSLSVVRMGRGEPVVCLTAIGHDALDYAPLAERLGAKYEFICIEWPGHGASANDSVPASAARYAELLEAVLWQLSVRSPILIGNSVGGAAGILYAARHDARGLVLCDSGGLVEIDAAVVSFCRLFTRFFLAGARRAWWFKPVFGLYYRVVLPSRSAAKQRRRIVATAHRIAPMLAQAWRSFGEPAADIRDVAAKLDVPIWIAWAKNDRVIPLWRCRAAIDRMQNASLDVFVGGHAAFLEQVDEFAEKFERFASRLQPSPQSRNIKDALVAA